MRIRIKPMTVDEILMLADPVQDGIHLSFSLNELLQFSLQEFIERSVRMIAGNEDIDVLDHSVAGIDQGKVVVKFIVDFTNVFQKWS